MTKFWIALNSWLWFLLIPAIVVALVLAVQVIRFLIKRVRLYVLLTRDSRRGIVNLRPCRPLWWLAGPRGSCDLLLDLKDPATGQTTHTLAVKLIPTLMQGTEYSIGDMDRWHTKLNFLVPMPYGVLRLDFGYRKCLPRPVERVFRCAPAGCINVYLFHPHPYALTLGRRGIGKGRDRRAVDELSVPIWHEGVLLLDLATLRDMETAYEEKRAGILSPVNA